MKVSGSLKNICKREKNICIATSPSMCLKWKLQSCLLMHIMFAHCLGISVRPQQRHNTIINPYYCLSYNVLEEWFWVLIVLGSLSISGFSPLSPKKNVLIFITFGMLFGSIFWFSSPLMACHSYVPASRCHFVPSWQSAACQGCTVVLCIDVHEP